MDLNPVTGVLIKRGNLDTHTHTHIHGECHVKMKAEVGVMFLQTAEHQRLPTNHQKIGERHGTDSPSQPSERTHPADTLILDAQPPDP